mmetsp:Transcript_77004/g.198301  ORF Transcript_77004/g.198301 Transcript_77004/m.198301 type:complete len:227 (+) Transcript_77004:87-767(+)
MQCGIWRVSALASDDSPQHRWRASLFQRVRGADLKNKSHAGILPPFGSVAERAGTCDPLPLQHHRSRRCERTTTSRTQHPPSLPASCGNAIVSGHSSDIILSVGVRMGRAMRPAILRPYRVPTSDEISLSSCCFASSKLGPSRYLRMSCTATWPWRARAMHVRRPGSCIMALAIMTWSSGHVAESALVSTLRARWSQPQVGTWLASSMATRWRWLSVPYSRTCCIV